jgi:hypothetical protein
MTGGEGYFTDWMDFVLEEKDSKRGMGIGI